MPTDDIDRPIFLQGPGRSGSTLVNMLLTLHPDVGYFTNWTARLPRLPFLAAGARLRMPAIERIRPEIPGLPRPTENYGFWLRCFPNYWRKPERPEVEAEGHRKFRLTIRQHLAVQRRSRFVIKTTGPPTFSFVRNMFPACKIVWIERDPRAVAYSFYKLGWIGVPKEQIPAMSDAERLTAATARYCKLHSQLERQSESAYTLRYEDFVADPGPVWARMLEYLELRRHPRYEAMVAQWPIHRSTNAKWRRHLPENLRAILIERLASAVKARGYAEEA